MANPFGNKNTDRLHSPEQLNGYITVVSPGVWMVIVAILIFLVGLFAWCIMGRIELTSDALVMSKSDSLVCYVAADDASKISQGMTVKVGDDTLILGEASKSMEKAGDILDANALSTGGFSSDSYLLAYSIQGSYKQGVYDANVVTGELSPADLLFG